MRQLLKILLGLQISLSFAMSAEYRPQDAVNYAHKYTIAYTQCGEDRVDIKNRQGKIVAHACPKAWNSYYSKRYSGSGTNYYGTDCMDFISQALHYAGIPMDKIGGGKINNPKVWYNDGGNSWPTDSWVRVSLFKERIENGYINDYDFQHIATNMAKEGDIIFIPGHIMMVTGKVTGSYLTYTAHTNDREDSKLYYSQYNCMVYRITPKNSSENNLPYPSIIQVDYPKNVLVGDEVEISIKIKNTGESTDKGYISVSFPGITENQIVSHDSHTRIYPAGTNIYSKTTKSVIQSQYLLVEYESDIWQSGETKTLTFKIRLDEISQQSFYVRSSLHIKGKSAGTTVDTPQKGDYIDQQGYEVKAYTIIVNDDNEQTKDKYENDNSKSQATILIPNKTQIHNIYPANDEDWFKFTINETSDIKIQTENEIGTIELTLFDSNMNEIDTDYSGIIRNSLQHGTYYVQAREHNEGGTDDYNILLTTKSTIMIPPSPANISATDGTYTNRIDITNYSISSATYYEIYRANSSGGSKTRISTTSSGIHSDISVVAGTYYYYYVKACNSNGCSPYSDYDIGFAKKVTIHNDFYFDKVTVNDKISDIVVSKGEDIHLYAKERYSGSKTGDVTNYIGYYLSNDKVLDRNRDIKIGQDEASPSSRFGHGKRETYTLPNTLESGDYYVLFVADDTNIVDEGSDESNNIRYVKITIKDSSIDSDGDGYKDNVDAFPNDPNEWADNDKDGIGDNADTDDDNDGISDADERKWGFDPLNESDGGSADADGDGVSNADEIIAGSDPLDPNDTRKPKRFVPVMVDDIVIMVPLS